MSERTARTTSSSHSRSIACRQWSARRWNASIPSLSSIVLLTPLLLLQACGVITSQSLYEGVRSTEKARAVVTDKSRQELPPYDDYERQRSGATAKRAD